MKASGGRRIYVIDELCNGCRRCEMMCSFVRAREFNPREACIRIAKVEEEGIDAPVIDCDVSMCPGIVGDEPECVRACATGALMYATADEAASRRQELVRKRAVQPVFKVIAPWKWPFPSWREWPFESEE